MNTLQLFTYGSQNVRTVIAEGEPWIVLSDLCSGLNIKNVGNAASRLNILNVRRADVQNSRGQMRQTTIVNEAGMWELALRSEKPEAVEFRQWITSEVIPSICKTGAYNVAAPAPAPVDLSSITRRQLAEAIIAEANRADAAEEQLAIVAPKVEAFEVLMGADNDWDVRDAAQLLCNDPGIDIGQNRLFAWLRDNKWISKKDNRPLQHRLDAGLMDSKLSTFVVKYVNGAPVFADPQARITPKGVEYLRKKLSTKQAIPHPTAKQPVRAIAAARKRKWQTLNP